MCSSYTNMIAHFKICTLYKRKWQKHSIIHPLSRALPGKWRVVEWLGTMVGFSGCKAWGGEWQFLGKYCILCNNSSSVDGASWQQAKREMSGVVADAALSVAHRLGKACRISKQAIKGGPGKGRMLEKPKDLKSPRLKWPGEAMLTV